MRFISYRYWGDGTTDHYFWPKDAQFGLLSPLLPNKPRGVPRVDDRRVISGIVNVLKSGERWVDAPSIYGPKKTLYNRFVRWADKGGWLDMLQTLPAECGPPAELLIDSTAVKAHRSASGDRGGKAPGHWPFARRAHDQDPRPLELGCRPVAFHLTGGQVADCIAAEVLLDTMPAVGPVHGDKGYDSDRFNGALKPPESRPTSRQSAIGAGNHPSCQPFTAVDTPLSACLGASRTSGASQPVTTVPQHTSWQPYAPRPSSATGPAPRAAKFERKRCRRSKWPRASDDANQQTLSTPGWEP